MSNVSAVPVLVEWENFIREKPQGSLREFAGWLLTHTEPLRVKNTSTEAEPLMKSGLRLSEAFQEGEDFLSWFFMGRLIRYVRFYTKSMMTAHGLGGPDEFLLLSLINEMDRPNKKEVCTAIAIELTTGMEMLRRLLRSGLIEEYADQQDARSKRLMITEKGFSTIQAIHEQLVRLQPRVLADLGAAERKQFLQTLQYLNNYHFPFYKP